MILTKSPLNQSDLETQFRIGACHATSWAWHVTRRMAKQGKTAEEISDWLGTLHQVMLDWRECNVSLPDGNPWEWKPEDLDAFIAKRKDQW
jgi:hypothetical protein